MPTRAAVAAERTARRQARPRRARSGRRAAPPLATTVPADDADQAPPPPAAQQDQGPTLLSDLPTDVLSLILALQVPPCDPHATSQRAAGRAVGRLKNVVRQALTCKAFAQAVRPPCALWEHVVVSGLDLLAGPAGGVGSQAAALAAAAPSITSLRVVWAVPPPRLPPAVATAVAAPVSAAASLGDLVYMDDAHASKADSPPWLAAVLGAAARLTSVTIGGVTVQGAAPLLARVRWSSLLYIIMEHGRSDALCASDSVDPARDLGLASLYYGGATNPCATLATMVKHGAVPPVALTALDDLVLPWNADQAQLLPALGGGRHLTRLRVVAPPDDDRLVGEYFARQASLHAERTRSQVASLAAALPALTDLHILVPALEDSTLDLRSLAVPPPGLTRLAVGPCFAAGATLLLPPRLAAGLASLEVECCGTDHPPKCLHNAGGAFRCLTRLAYGLGGAHLLAGDDGPEDRLRINLAAWGHAPFRLASLTDLEVCGRSFEIRDYVGPDWATAVATDTLPRLARLRLVSPTDPGEMFADDEAEDAVTRRLPAAAARAGRGLVVGVDADRFLQKVDEYVARAPMCRSAKPFFEAVGDALTN